MPRRARDFYPTPTWATEELVRSIALHRCTVLEPCCGDGAIASVLSQNARRVSTNDIDPQRPAQTHADASVNGYWDSLPERHQWVVTNPPFSLAPLIVPRALSHATIGIAMLLRLSFLEPVANRVDFLATHPPTGMIVLPRISFTGDGKTDSVTCAWMIWEHYGDAAVKIARRLPRSVDWRRAA